MENENKTNELEKTEDFEMVQEETNEPEPEVEQAVEEEQEPISYSSSYMENIENARSHFLGVYRLHNTFKWIITAIAFAAMIIAFIVVPNVTEGNTSTIVVSAVAVGALTLVLLYSFLSKRYITKKMHSYFNLYYDNVNRFVFDSEHISNMQSQFPGKIQPEAFLDNNLFKDVTDVGSRGLTEFEYKGVPIAVCDCAGQTRNSQKRIIPVFVGKYLYAASSYDYDEPLYIYYKGDKRALPPTNLADVKVVQEDAKMIVYSNNSKWKQVLDASIKKILNSISTNKELVDLSISLQKGRMFVCMGYDDPLMVLPLQNQFNPKPNEIFKEDVKNVLELIKEFNK